MLRLRASSRIALAASLLIVTCCQTPQPPPPAPAPAPAPTPVTTPAPAPAPVAPEANWIDRPQTAGDWSLRIARSPTIAYFKATNGEGLFALTCNRSSGTIALIRKSDAASPRPMVIRTETANRAFTAKPQTNVLGESVVTVLPASDPFFDAMAITRGRFAVEVEGEAGLYLPAWAEVTRVIEDCR